MDGDYSSHIVLFEKYIFGNIGNRLKKLVDSSE